jgi:hypothetical protein
MAETARSRPERLQVMLNPDELAAVENFRFNNRIPSRAAAARELLKRGLAAERRETSHGRGRRDARRTQ